MFSYAILMCFTAPVYFLCIGDRPTMKELRSFKRKTDGKVIDIVTEIGTDYKKLGVILLDNDKKVTSIAANNFHRMDDTVDEILREWLKGDGKGPVTWDTLAEALGESGLKTLAEDISS